MSEDGSMDDLEQRSAHSGSGRILGWLSGLGIIAVPWIVSGIISTFTPEPESSFPWVFLAAFVAMVGWIVYGVIRIPRFRKGALIGSGIALAVVALLYILVQASSV